MPTEHQLLVTVLAYRKDCRRQFRYDLDFSLAWTSHGKNICFTEIFCNHPEKGGKMSPKKSTSACTRIHIHSEIGKENKARISKSYNLLIFTIKLPQKDEMMMKTKPCIE